MATARLVPSIMYTTETALSITNESNAYANVDSTNYATITNTTSGTNNRYLYIRGFNFNSIPANADVTAFTVKIKGYYTSGYSASMYLCNGTTRQSGATASSLSASINTQTFRKGSLTWSTIKGWGDNFGIRVNCRRNQSNTQATYYIYGAEIEVTYTAPQTDSAYIKVNGSWVLASKVYKKINGSWVEQNDLTSVFDANTNYKIG